VSWSVASSAGKSSLVDFSSIASEAYNGIIFFNGFFMLFWSDYLAVNFLLNSLNSWLAPLRLSLDRAIAEGFLYISLDLGSNVLHINHSVQLFFVGKDILSIDSHVVESNQVVDFSGGVVMIKGWSIPESDRVGSGLACLHLIVIELVILEVTAYSPILWNHVKLSIDIGGERNRRSHGEVWLNHLTSLLNGRGNHESELVHHWGEGFFKIFLATDWDEISIRILIEEFELGR
jgi:hypothetical protein